MGTFCLFMLSYFVNISLRVTLFVKPIYGIKIGMSGTGRSFIYLYTIYRKETRTFRSLFRHHIVFLMIINECSYFRFQARNSFRYPFAWMQCNAMTRSSYRQPKALHYSKYIFCKNNVATLKCQIELDAKPWTKTLASWIYDEIWPSYGVGKFWPISI